MSSALVVCAFCAREFHEDRGQPACRACPLAGHPCRLIRCPHCGYENPVPPAWLAHLTRRLVSHDAR